MTPVADASSYQPLRFPRDGETIEDVVNERMREELKALPITEITYRRRSIGLVLNGRMTRELSWAWC